MSNRIDQMEMEEIRIPDKMNIFKRLGNLLFSPSKLFAYIKKKPTILFPIILFSIVAAVNQFLLWEPTKGTQIDIIYNTYRNMGMNITAAQAEQMVEGQKILSIATTPIIFIATWLVLTLVLYLIFRIVKCEKGLKKYFSMIGYITLISVAGQLIHTGYLYLSGNDILSAQVTSLASFLHSENSGTFLYSIASQIEIFNIWTYILYAIGFIYTGGVPKRKSYITTMILFVIILLGGAGISVLSNQVMSSLMGPLAG